VRASSNSSRPRLHLCLVDEPQGFSSSVPPVVAVTAPLVMLRFHGRNRETWEKKGISTAENSATSTSRASCSRGSPTCATWRNVQAGCMPFQQLLLGLRRPQREDLGTLLS